MKMNRVALALVLLLPAALWAECPAWKPEMKFKLDGADELQTLAWLGGWSSAVNEAANSGDLELYVPECGYLISKEIVEILNMKYAGENVSAEQASTYFWPLLKKALSGSPNKKLQPNADAPAE